jgi:hypothetical protein
VSEVADSGTSTTQTSADTGAATAAATQTASFLESMTAEATTSAAPADAAPAAPSADGRPEGVPEKFWDAEKKAIRTDDVLKSYTALEQRMRDGGAPPKDVTGYTFEPPEDLKDIELDAERTQEFKQFCHGLGLTTKQYQGVMERYVGTIGDIAEQAMQYQRTECEAQLKAVWKNDADIRKNVGLALKAFNALADEDIKAELPRLGNNPALLRILAKVGAEMQEDTATVAQHVQQPEDLSALMKNPAYWNEQHPDHERIKAKVRAHFEAEAKLKGRQAA